MVPASVAKNRFRRNRSSGLAISSKVIVATLIVVAFLATLIVIGTVTASAGTTVTTTKSVTTTLIQSSPSAVALSSSGTSPSSTNSSPGLNAEQIYSSSDRSIVVLQGTQVQSSYFGSQQIGILGSGFVIQYSGSDYIVTNYHVAGATSNLTVTFSDGDSYPAKVVGSDPYADLAIVSVQNAPASEFSPLSLASSSSLLVGEPVAAIGNPFGLSGSMTVGIVSQLGRTIQDPTAGNFSIADAIQFSAPINPGNSGGPLLNAEGQAVGITTATESNSQGVGFAIPSQTIIKELPSLVSSGTYTQHSYMGIEGADMNYQLAKAAGTNVTYGVMVETTVQGGPAANAGLRGGNTGDVVTIEGSQYLLGGDIIVSINGTRIINNDALATYLEVHTIAGEKIALGIIRSGSPTTVDMTLGTRPPVSG